MDQHKRTVHIFVGTPPFGGAMKIVRWPLWSSVPDLRCKFRDALGQTAQILETLIGRDAEKGAVEEMRGKAVRYVKFHII